MDLVAAQEKTRKRVLTVFQRFRLPSAKVLQTDPCVGWAGGKFPKETPGRNPGRDSGRELN